VGLQWNHESAAPTDDIIDASHKGPCLVYLSADNGATWFKIYENGYNTTTLQFCVITLIANKGLLNITIPADIAPGNYLMRGEIIALHQAENIGGAQPYVDCSELTITGGGKATPAGVAIPGAYKDTDPGILFNIYNGFTSYPIPGPTLYVASSNANPSDDVNPSVVTAKTSGGLSAGGAAVLAISLIALVACVAVGVFYYKNGHIFGHTFLKNNSSGTMDRKGGNYVAFTENSL